jgi:hypothetical protein
MTHWKTTRRQFLAASGMVAMQTAISGWPAAAEPTTSIITKRFRFANGSAGMLPCYTDYPLGEPDYQFLAEVRPLPSGVPAPGWSRNAYYIQGNNHSDDLFMFLKANVNAQDGIVPNQDYLLSFDLWFASASGGGCSGVGGSPDSVYLKAGGSTVEPVPLLQGNDVLINIDKGDQSTGGRNLGVIGSIYNGKECPSEIWVMLHRKYDHPFPIRSTSGVGGDLWIAVGTESGYEALTGVYYYSIDVRLTPVAS